MSELLSETKSIVTALRAGVVPHRGLERYAVGMDTLTAAVCEELDEVAKGKGASKWLRGSYGCGKTFAARYLCARARERGFATAEVQISSADTPLHHLETIYRRAVERLETADEANAFRVVVDDWFFRLGAEVTASSGITEHDPRFAAAVEDRVESKLGEVARRAPAFAQVLRAYHRATDAQDYGTAQGLLAWLAGQPNTKSSVLKAAGTKGKLDGQGAFSFLRGLLLLLRQSGSQGLVLVFDEVETLQRLSGEPREKALNVLRQLIDALANDELPGLYLIVTGTPEFFDGARGLQALPPLYHRVQVDFGDDPAFDNLRAPQVRLPLFDAERLLTVGQKVRELYPAKDPARLESRAGKRFLKALVKGVTSRFGGDVSIAPRTFLRELIDVLDRVDQHPAFDPLKDYKLVLADAELTPEELAATKAVTE